MAITALIGCGLLATSVPAARAAADPVATNDFYPGDAGEHLVVDAPGVLANDSDTDGYQPLVMSPPDAGTVSLHADGSFDYDPQGATGEHTFSYCLVAAPGGGSCVSDPAIVSLFIDEPFVALHFYTTVQDEALTVNAPGLLEGSRNPGPQDTLYLKSSPPNGVVSDFNTDGSFTYTPNAGFVGNDAFAYCFSNEQVWPQCSGNAGSVTITVDPPVLVETTTTQTAPASIFYGQTATLTATVSPVVAGGTITFSGGGATVCQDVPVTSSTATCTVPAASLDVGAHSYVASFSGFGKFFPSTSPVATVTVNPAPTALAYTGASTGTIGSPVQVSAELTNAADGATGPVPGQTLRFGMANGLSCTADTNAAGIASCSMTANRVGNLAVTVAYNGDVHYQGEQIDGVVLVAKKASATSVHAAPNPVPWSDDVTLTAAVTAGATGTVAFEVAGVAITGCVAVPVTDGTATCVTDGLEAGSQQVTAHYSGDDTYADSLGNATVQVQKRAVDISYVGPATGTVGSALALSGKAIDHLSGEPVAGLRLDLSFQGLGCGGNTDASGIASCNVFVRQAGTSDATVTFAGDPHYLTSDGSGAVTIAKAAAAITVTIDPTPTDFTLPVTVTATVTPTDGGTVAFTTGGTALAGCDAVALVQDSVQPARWTASCTTAILPVGDDEITATFSGTDNYLGSADSATATVRPAPTALSYTGATAGTVAAPLAVSAVLTNIAGADPVPLSGRTVVFTLADGITCTAVTDDSATATCTLTPTAIAQAGPLSVTFGGTTDYLKSTTTADISVAPAATTTAVTAPETAAFGTAVTIEAAVSPNDGVGAVAFTLAGTAIEGCEAVTPTDRAGHWVAGCVTTALPVGDDEITATYSGTADYLGSAGTATVVETPAPTALAYTGGTEGIVGAPLTVSAVLTNTAADATIAGQLVDFTRGGLACTATTGDDGTAACELTPTAVAQAGPISVTFAGTTDYLESAVASDISVAPAATTLDYLGPDAGTAGSPLAVSAELRIVSSAPAPTVAAAVDGHPLRGISAVRVAAAPAPATAVSVAGLRVTFTLGSVSCTAVTDAAGNADCSLTPTAADPTAQLVVAFAGTADLAAAEATTSIVVALAPQAPPTTSGPPATSTGPTSTAGVPPTSSPGAFPPAADDGLASTGFDPTGWLTIGVLLLAAGALLFVVGRLRRTSTHRHRIG